MGNFSQQREERQANLPLWWNGDYDGDTLTGKVLGASMIDNKFKSGEMIPSVALQVGANTTTIEATRKALAFAIIDADPEPGDWLTIVRTGSKPNKNPTFKPTILYTVTNHGKKEPSEAAVSAKAEVAPPF